MITATHQTHWEVTALGAHVTVRDVSDRDALDPDWLVFNRYGQALPNDNPITAAAISVVAAV